MWILFLMLSARQIFDEEIQGLRLQDPPNVHEGVFEDESTYEPEGEDVPNPYDWEEMDDFT